MSDQKVKDLILEPFLHFEKNGVYNPLTDKRCQKGTSLYGRIVAIRDQSKKVLSKDCEDALLLERWVIPYSDDLNSRYYLKVVKIEGNAHCNQRCYFCPVSISPKEVHTMDLEMYDDIVAQLIPFRDTIQAVFMINYNEPTVDKHFIERIKILNKYDLPVCINTNGSGLSPKKVDQIMEIGALRFLSINLTTLDHFQYEQERKFSRLDIVLRNLNYMKSLPLAQEMVIAVLGHMDEKHEKNFLEIQDEYGGSNFEIKKFELMDRAGCLHIGKALEEPISRLGGCENLGSRPVQHLHINAYGECTLCCQDYYEEYKVGDLKTNTVEEVLTSAAFQSLRAKAYGLEEADDEFICKKCVFALDRDQQL